MPTQDETRHVAGYPAYPGDEEENNKDCPGWTEDLGQARKALQCHGSKQDGLPPKPANPAVKVNRQAAYLQIRDVDIQADHPLSLGQECPPGSGILTNNHIVQVALHQKPAFPPQIKAGFQGFNLISVGLCGAIKETVQPKTVILPQV